MYFIPIDIHMNRFSNRRTYPNRNFSTRQNNKTNYVARKDIFESSRIASFIYNLLMENFELLSERRRNLINSAWTVRTCTD